MGLNFFIEWIVFYGSIMLAMSLDNIFWIPTSPEYEKIKKGDYPVKVGGKEYHNLKDYILRYRILSVLTSWRDVIPGIISSLILAVIF